MVDDPTRRRTFLQPEHDTPSYADRVRPLRAPAIAIGCSYLLAILMLGPLLGSSADASTVQGGVGPKTE